MRVCVVGSGPAGFYVAERLLKYSPSIHINMVEERYSPFGLIRFGVAPDHPEVKNCTQKFSKILQNDHVRFFGGLRVGCDISLDFLHKTHDILVLCTGIAKSKDLKIPGSKLENVFTSEQFVGWYNNDPNMVTTRINLSQVNDAVIIGNGNVSLDVARLLLKSASELKSTNISRNALIALENSSLENLTICARRGLLQVNILCRFFSFLLFYFRHHFQ